jgi:hypothetical protein
MLSTPLLPMLLLHAADLQELQTSMQAIDVSSNRSNGCCLNSWMHE